MACHLHEEFNFRSNMTQKFRQSCAEKREKGAAFGWNVAVYAPGLYTDFKQKAT
jgi:hypothetical protein